MAAHTLWYFQKMELVFGVLGPEIMVNLVMVTLAVSTGSNIMIKKMIVINSSISNLIFLLLLVFEVYSMYIL